jgi:hypothetical protein
MLLHLADSAGRVSVQAVCMPDGGATRADMQCGTVRASGDEPRVLILNRIWVLLLLHVLVTQLRIV